MLPISYTYTLHSIHTYTHTRFDEALFPPVKDK